MSSLLGAIIGTAAGRAGGSSSRPASSSEAESEIRVTTNSIFNAELATISVLGDVGKIIRDDINEGRNRILNEIYTTRDWINGVQENINLSRGQIAHVQDGTNALLEMAQRNESDHVEIANAFNAMSDAIGEMNNAMRDAVHDMHNAVDELKNEVKALRAELEARK